MASLNKFYSFVQALGTKTHNLSSDSFKVALSNVAPALTNTQLSNITEISYTFCSSRAITTTSFLNTTGTSKFILADLTLSASGGSVGPFRYIVIYNDSATNKELVGYYDYGSAVTVGDGDAFLIDFDGANGFLQLS